MALAVIYGVGDRCNITLSDPASPAIRHVYFNLNGCTLGGTLGGTLG